MFEKLYDKIFEEIGFCNRNYIRFVVLKHSFMRIKISFLKVHGSNGTVPLHHQKIVSAFIDEVAREISIPDQSYNFSSLKGTSKVQNGQIRFLSSKVSLVLSSANELFLKTLVDKIFERRLVSFAKLTLVPKSQYTIPDPDFKTLMKYVCISPVIPDNPIEAGNDVPDPINPTTTEFSDMLYDVVIDKMEKHGYGEEQLNQFAEFEIAPDADYIQKIISNQKKFARLYKNNDNLSILGYLLPFTMHAHPEVHKFVWQQGLGKFTLQGYGMLDIVGHAAEETE